VLHRRATLVDLLDRVLDRGVVLQADVVITLAGVPLVGASLRLALAGMETMTRYGLLTEWDQRIRRAAQAAPRAGLPLAERRPCLAEMSASGTARGDVLLDEVMWYRAPASGAVGPTWRRGRLFLTTGKLCWRYSFDDRVLFEARLADLTGAAVEVRDLDGLVGRCPVLVVSHNGSGPPDTALFCTGPADAGALTAWAEAIRSALPAWQRTPLAALVPRP